MTDVYTGGLLMTLSTYLSAHVRSGNYQDKYYNIQYMKKNYKGIFFIFFVPLGMDLSKNLYCIKPGF